MLEISEILMTKLTCRYGALRNNGQVQCFDVCRFEFEVPYITFKNAFVEDASYG